MTTFLVQLNVEVPDDAPCNAVDVSREVVGALNVGMDEDNTPALFFGDWVVASSEQI